MRVTTDCILVAKEFKKATEEREFNGKTYPAKPKSWHLHFLIGSYKDAEDELFYGEPTLVSAQVSKDSFDKVENKFFRSMATVDIINMATSALTKIIRVNGIDVIGVVNEDDEE